MTTERVCVSSSFNQWIFGETTACHEVLLLLVMFGESAKITTLCRPLADLVMKYFSSLLYLG